jgi:hypothetical protein
MALQTVRFLLILLKASSTGFANVQASLPLSSRPEWWPAALTRVWRSEL